MVEFKDLLVPLDGSHLAESVLPATMLLAQRLDARVILLHVMEHGLPQTVHGEPHLFNQRQAERYLAGIASRFAAAGITVDYHVHPNLERDVVKSIVDHAEELDSDMIVLCTHGQGGLRNALVGSIAQQVLQQGERPVFLIRPNAAGEPPRFQCLRLLVPLDGRPEHEASVPAAQAIASACGATIHLLVVVPTLDTVQGNQTASALFTPQATAAILDVEEEQATTYLSNLGNRLCATGLNVTAEVRRGDPTRIAVEVANQRHADLLVTATHARTGLDALWSGSVAPRILRRLTQPVLLVHADEQPA